MASDERKTIENQRKRGIEIGVPHAPEDGLPLVGWQCKWAEFGPLTTWASQKKKCCSENLGTLALSSWDDTVEPLNTDSVQIDWVLQQY